MEEALVAYLLASAGLTGLVSDRVNWARRPQEADLPSVVLHRISGLPGYTMGGVSGLTESRVQVDCWGSTYASAKAVARQVESRLTGTFTQDGVRFQGSFKDGERDDYERGPGNADLFRVSMDILLWHGDA